MRKVEVRQLSLIEKSNVHFLSNAGKVLLVLLMNIEPVGRAARVLCHRRRDGGSITMLIRLSSGQVDWQRLRADVEFRRRSFFELERIQIVLSVILSCVIH